MLVDVSEFPYARIQANSLMIIRVPPNGWQDPAALHELAKNLHERVDDSVDAMVIPDTMTVELLDENAMKVAGWVRADKVAPPQEGQPNA